MSREWITAAAVAVLASLFPPAASASGTYGVTGFVGDRPGGTGGLFTAPVDVAIDHGFRPAEVDDRIYVLEGPPSNRVRRLDRDANEVAAWPAPGRPGGVAVDPVRRTVLTTDAAARAVTEFDPAGRRLRQWPIDVGGTPRNGPRQFLPIAPVPGRPGAVLVGDSATSRLLLFGRGGELVRAWGWGVADGRGRFQACGPDPGACRAGLPPRERGAQVMRWPSQIAVDGEGIAYASAFLGKLFEDDRARTRVERVPLDVEDGPSATRLAPLLAPDPNRGPTFDPPAVILTNGTTEGLDIVPASGELLAINNPFGPSQIDRLEAPGRARAELLAQPRLEPSTLPFLQNVTGIASSRDGGIVLLSSGRMREETGRSAFTGCADPDTERDCHGLVVLARGGASAALALAPGAPGEPVTPLLLPAGSVRYRVEVSNDGVIWSGATPWRNALGTKLAARPATIRADAPGVYLARLTAVRKTPEGLVRTTSNEAVVAIARPRPDAVSP
ncbi:MAG: hypothetical protein GXY03_06340 [Solirubrobacterales bacterium]|nr:hypothetical protein [Solirubrobacterales bacterium]